MLKILDFCPSSHKSLSRGLGAIYISVFIFWVGFKSFVIVSHTFWGQGIFGGEGQGTHLVGAAAYAYRKMVFVRFVWGREWG